MESSNRNTHANSAKPAQFAWAKFLDNKTTGDQPNDEIENSPLIPEFIYNLLPDILKEGSKVFKDQRERDVFLTGALGILSGCFGNVTGLYDGKEVAPNLYSFIVAPAANGKGVLTYAKALGMKIHKKLLDAMKSSQEKYRVDIKQFNADFKKNKTSAEPPKEPKTTVLFIPANSSAANVIKLLEDNDGSAIICETEADTMANSFKQDWGGYSDLLRKAFHHEAITYSRKTGSEFVEVSLPRLSVILSGTPSQVGGLILSNEDGLFSRFLFYYYKAPSIWRDVSNVGGVNYNDHFTTLADQVDKIHEELKSKKIEFVLSHKQWDILNSYHASCLGLMSEEMSSSIYRSGLIAYRIAMVLSILRNEKNLCYGCQMLCSDVDLNIAITLTDVYLAHDVLAYKLLLAPKGKKIDGVKMKLFEALPSTSDFTRHQALEVGETFSVKERTVGKYLKEYVDNGMLDLVRHGVYKKK